MNLFLPSARNSLSVDPVPGQSAVRSSFDSFSVFSSCTSGMSRYRPSSSRRYQEGHECQPIHTISELLEFERHPVSWRSLVHPLVARSGSRYLGERYQEIDFNAGITDFVEDGTRPQVLLCHDFKGNYLTDRFINGTTGGPWVDYRFYNWAAVDVFCYFSHSFVTIPTLQWLDCAHKNGVKVIGTFIIEAGNASFLKDILQSEESARRVADALVSVARICQFEVRLYIVFGGEVALAMFVIWERYKCCLYLLTGLAPEHRVHPGRGQGSAFDRFCSLPDAEVARADSRKFDNLVRRHYGEGPAQLAERTEQSESELFRGLRRHFSQLHLEQPESGADG